MEEKRIDANKIVSPKNTEKLYDGRNLGGHEPRPGDMETIETSLPQEFEGVDQEVGHNVYPSQSAEDQTDETDL